MKPYDWEDEDEDQVEHWWSDLDADDWFWLIFMIGIIVMSIVYAGDTANFGCSTHSSQIR